jgi:steroid delta-isomerase
VIFSGVALVLTGCSTFPPKEATSMGPYLEALTATEPGEGLSPKPGSDVEKQALARFTEFYKEFSTDSISNGIRKVYSEDTFFEDPFKTTQGIDALEEYMLKSAKTVNSCTFKINEIAVSSGNYYARWVMNLSLNRSPDKPMVAGGVTHFRLNKDGLVNFHKDHWNAGEVYERIPLLGSMIRYIKGKF